MREDFTRRMRAFWRRQMVVQHCGAAHVTHAHAWEDKALSVLNSCLRLEAAACRNSIPVVLPPEIRDGRGTGDADTASTVSATTASTATAAASAASTAAAAPAAAATGPAAPPAAVGAALIFNAHGLPVFDAHMHKDITRLPVLLVQTYAPTPGETDAHRGAGGGGDTSRSTSPDSSSSSSSSSSSASGHAITGGAGSGSMSGGSGDGDGEDFGPPVGGADGVAATSGSSEVFWGGAVVARSGTNDHDDGAPDTDDGGSVVSFAATGGGSYSRVAFPSSGAFKRTMEQPLTLADLALGRYLEALS